jgi:plasmid stabilization system protein ParE
VRLRWTDRALARLRETTSYIAADDPAAAVRWVEGLFDAAARLADFPESGRLAPELEDRGVRELVYGAYRVFYRIDAEVVLILTVRHASQLIREDEVGEGRT